VILPVSGFRDLGERRAFLAAEQFQNDRGFASGSGVLGSLRLALEKIEAIPLSACQQRFLTEAYFCAGK